MQNYQKIVIFLIILVLMGGGVFWYFSRNLKRSKGETLRLNETINEINLSKTMKLTSPVFENNQLIPAKYSCDGQDINPPLDISGVPEGTQSLVLIIDDPDAPMGTWDHWIVWNINPSISQIKESQVPEGAVEGLNDFKRQSYGGPCPPSGTHHYHFRLYALDKKLNLSPLSKKEDVEKAMQGSILDRAEIIGLYRR